MIGCIWLLRRFQIAIPRKEPSLRSALWKFSITLAVCLGIMIFFAYVKLPWTNFAFTPLSIVLALPLLIVCAFAVAGFRYIQQTPQGYFILGWLMAIIASLIFSIVTNSTALFPHRHIEYMMAPLSVISLYGMNEIILGFRWDIFSRFSSTIRENKNPAIYYFRKSPLFQKRNLLFVIVIVFIASANALSVYPSHVALNASYEVITADNLASTEWISQHLDKNRSVIASDHRLARLAEAKGFNTTIDEATNLWITDHYVDSLTELEGIGKNYSRITHIIIDDILVERVVHVGFGKIYYMTEKSYAKFSEDPFILIYRNATLDPFGEEESWTEVYEVDWSFIDDLFR